MCEMLRFDVRATTATNLQIRMHVHVQMCDPCDANKEDEEKKGCQRHFRHAYIHATPEKTDIAAASASVCDRHVYFVSW